MNPTSLRPADSWGPLYYLASLGAGGLAVTFFMWLMFWVPHPGVPVPLHHHIWGAFASGTPLMQGMIALAVAGIAVFAALNLILLGWNIARHRAWRRTEAYGRLRQSNAETQLTALPLALAMSINVGFVIGMVFVPGLWNVVEYLFPLALAAFAAVGVIALRQIGAFLGRVKVHGGFDWSANNSFAQILPAFALAMVGVGLSAPSAMSGMPLVSGIALILSTFFLVASVIIAVVALVLGVHSMMEHGANPETAPTLLIVIPLMTVLGILMLRQAHGMHVHFGSEESRGEVLSLLTKFLSLELVFGLFGWLILRRQNYAARFVLGRETSVGSYALICPGVALSVMTHFWINKGLVGAGLIAKFGAAYWVLSGVAVAFQIAMIVLLVVLNRRHFRRAAPAGAVPAE